MSHQLHVKDEMQNKNPNKGNWKPSRNCRSHMSLSVGCRTKIPIKGIERRVPATPGLPLVNIGCGMQNKNPNKGNWKRHSENQRLRGESRCRTKIPIKGIESKEKAPPPPSLELGMQNKNPNKGNWKLYGRVMVRAPSGKDAEQKSQ